MSGTVTVAQFWNDMAKAFEVLKKRTQSLGLDTLAAHRTTDGQWVITGGNDEIRDEFKHLAAIAGHAKSGQFPGHVKQPRS